VPAPDAVFTTAPTPLTMGIGSSAVYEIGGGLAPYTVSSSNAGVATGVLQADTKTFKITGISAGTANIVVRDSTGASTTIAVTVPATAVTPGVAFFTDAPASITIPTAGIANFNLSGGTPGYTATTNNSAVATVTQPTATTYRITGVAAGTAIITLKDATGAVLTVGVTVSSSSTAIPLFTTAPPAIIIGPGAAFAQQYQVGGGVTPYTVTSTSPAIVSAVITGTTTLTITGNVTGSSTITVRDDAGTTKSIAVTVQQPGTVLQLLPAALSVSESDTATPIDLKIFGGTGAYTPFTSNLALSSVAIVGTDTFRITAGTSGNRCVSGTGVITLTVVDSLGASSTSQLTIVDDPGLACPPP
jgi:hypothetical protein